MTVERPNIIRRLLARLLSVPVIPHPDDWFPQ